MTQTHHQAVADRATAATAIIRDAGALALSYFQSYRNLVVEAKSNPQDIVSAADREVERRIRNALVASFPQDGIIGEEHGHLRGTSGYTWLVDPIDGTSPFLHGLRNWCVVVALLHGDRPVLGLIYDPSGEELFAATAGGGATLNGHSIRVDDRSELDQGLTALSAVTQVPGAHIAGVIERLHDCGGAFIRLGSAALTLAYVAAGRLVGYYEPQLHAWDCVAGLLLVQEAGGMVDEFPIEQGPLATAAVFAATPRVHASLRSLVEATP
jgi:myo-inositol-1(or 4)-monophosphatase